MSENKIILEEILQLKNKEAFDTDGFSNYFTSAQRSIILNAMKEACQKVLELGTENVTLSETLINGYRYPDKQSILDTINQVE